uniref:Uncharacterized protein n=1 Tax=Plectus sambesii TaxID=2011161 RepID=A0A914V3F0_9BILA
EATPKIAANGRPPFNSARVDVWQTWKQLLKGFLLGPLAASRATALSFKRTEDGRSMAISNPRCMAIQKEMTKEDPLDDEVLSVDKAIRSSGYKGRMKYKPDAFSVCQITHSNQRVIRPTIYLSEVNQFTGERITTDYTRDYTPEVRMGNHSAYRRQQSEAVGSSPDASPSIRRHQSASSASQMSESLRVVTPQQMQSTDSFSSSNTTVCGPSGFGRGQAGSRRPTAAVWATSLKPG